MSPTSTLDEVLDAAESLDHESRKELVSVLSKRLAESSREDLVRRVQESQRQFAAGQFEVLTPAEIIAQASS